MMVSWLSSPILWILVGFGFVFGEGVLLTYKDWHYFLNEPEQKNHDDKSE